jgi:hypothetical protein
MLRMRYLGGRFETLKIAAQALTAMPTTNNKFEWHIALLVLKIKSILPMA